MRWVSIIDIGPSATKTDCETPIIEISKCRISKMDCFIKFKDEKYRRISFDPLNMSLAAELTTKI